MNNHGTNSPTPGGIIRDVFVRSCSGISFCVLAALMLLTLGVLPARPDPLAQKKSALNARLDSLEMEKQQRKRLGLPLVQLDSVSMVLKDSMAAIKQEISLTGDPVETLMAPENMLVDTTRLSLLDRLKKARVLPHFPALPKTTLDWIIAAVALIALLSGIVLFMGLFRAFVFRPKKPKPAFAVRAQTPYTHQGLPGQQQEVPKKMPVERAVPAAAAPAGFDIEALRRTIAKGDLEGNNTPLPRFSGEPSAAAPAEAAPDGDTLKQRIIQAGREGLSVPEISRKFHVSVDQVALILKIAGKK